MVSQSENETTKKDKEHSPVIISFVSGKGGVGKTSLCLSLARLLSVLGKRVLFIDFDLATHGATYFFIDYLKDKKGFVEVLAEVSSHLDNILTREKMLIRKAFNTRFEETEYYQSMRDFESKRESIIHENVKTFMVDYFPTLLIDTPVGFKFIPSKVDFQKSSFSLTTLDFTVKPMLVNIIEHFKPEFDFILIDTQAGSVPSSAEVVKLSNKVILATQPDPICVSAANNLKYEFKEFLPTYDTLWILNGILLEEAKSYSIIENYLTIFEHLPPIPFDFEVRKAFARRRIPLDIDNPSAFFFGMTRMTKELLPDLKADLEVFEKGQKEKVSHPIEEKIKNIDSKISILQKGLYRRMQRLKFVLYIILSFFVIGSSILLFFLRGGTEKLSPYFSIASILFLVIMMINLISYSKPIRQTNIENELSHLSAERNRYETLLITKSDELLLEQEILKEHEPE